jgi:hypothetical protein
MVHGTSHHLGLDVPLFPVDDVHVRAAKVDVARCRAGLPAGQLGTDRLTELVVPVGDRLVAHPRAGILCVTRAP